jgi:hypothetical protein
MKIENLTFNDLSSKELSRKSGVYKLSIKEHIYIGSSKNLYSRLAEHRTDLYYRRHSNGFLQKACNKYGIENIRIDIVEFCPPEKRIEREKYWIDTLQADMNMQDPVNHTLCEASKEKLSKSIKAGIAEGRYKKKYDFAKIECYDYFGDYITSYDTKEEAAKACGISVHDVVNCLGAYKHGTKANGKSIGKAVHGYRFRYSCSNIPPMKFDIRPLEVGRYFNFYYTDENGKHQKAFSCVKDCWEFFTKHCRDKQIIITPILKSRESGNLSEESETTLIQAL